MSVNNKTVKQGNVYNKSCQYKLTMLIIKENGVLFVYHQAVKRRIEIQQKYLNKKEQFCHIKMIVVSVNNIYNIFEVSSYLLKVIQRKIELFCNAWVLFDKVTNVRA